MKETRYEIELDPDLLDVLASETRRRILQTLGERRHTLSELARNLDRNKSTIHEHLGRLAEAELVHRDEDDDRKWTYYELSDEGQRILNPQRTNVRLVIGAAVAGLVAGLLVAASVAGVSGLVPGIGGETGGPDATQPDGAAYADGAALDVSLARDEALSRNGSTIAATMAGDADGPVRAYLVSETEAQAFETAGDRPSGIPLEVEVDGRDVTLRLPADARPGDYRLYLAAGDDALDPDAMPRVRLRESLAAVDEPTYWRGLSSAPTVARTSPVVPADATLVLEREAGDARDALTVDLAGGNATLGVEALDDLPAGTYRLEAVPDEGGPIPLGARLEVRSPHVVLEPAVVREDRPVDLQVHVRPAEAADAGVPVRVDGEPRDAAFVDRGTRTVRVEPAEAGRFPVEVGRTAVRGLTVLPTIEATVSVVDGPAWELEVHNDSGEPEPGVGVFVDGGYRASTNASGLATIDVPEEGDHALRLTPPDAPAVEVPVRAEGWNATVLSPHVGLDAAASSPSPRRLAVSVSAANGGPTPVDGTLVTRVQGEVAGADDVSVPANASTETSVEVEDVPSGELNVTVEAAAPTSPNLAVRNETSGGGSDGGGEDVSPKAESADSEDGASSTVVAGLDRTSVEVADHVGDTLEETWATEEPIQGAAAPVGEAGEADAPAEAAEAPEAVPSPLAPATAAALAAAACLLRRRGRG